MLNKSTKRVPIAAAMPPEKGGEGPYYRWPCSPLPSRGINVPHTCVASGPLPGEFTDKAERIDVHYLHGYRMKTGTQNGPRITKTDGLT